AGGGERHHEGGAELRRHPDDALHLVSLRHALGQRETQRRLGRMGGPSKDDGLRPSPVYSLDPYGEHGPCAVQRLHHVSGAETQHPREVARLLDAQGDAVASDVLGADAESPHTPAASRSSADQPSMTIRSRSRNPAGSRAAITLESSASSMPPRMSAPPGAARRT